MSFKQYACLRSSNGPLWIKAKHIIWFEYNERFDKTTVYVGPDIAVFDLPGEQLGELMGAINRTPMLRRIENGMYKEAIKKRDAEGTADGRQRQDDP